ncbi:Tetratricopeptide repeat [Seminavis robusta]|uniref:Tetratricopeptide repeat n=1 Tax=Seminavis robusta TaxID=568900 RepID=A0A9N8EK07_9STRA|nr:Tetratricopeptide repeat [Seminavis robusta]|eukprot:Sro1125_g243940.1 Tetratricopeptide repeat (766) ;mRNA; f:20636-22933
MRNPLKKITKKINFRLASNAAQHSNSKTSSSDKGDGKATTSSKKKQGTSRAMYNRSHTESEHDDPLFNNRSSKLRLALAESKKNANAAQRATAAADQPKKKKKSRMGFGTMGSSRKTNPDKAENDNQQHKNSSQDNNNNKQQQDTLLGPASSERAPKSVEQSLPATTSSEDKTPPRRTPSSSKFDAPTVSSQQKMRDKRDPHLERIAKAAAALDNTGNEMFERGEYDKAMAHYVKALKLKNRTLAGSQQLDELGNPIITAPLPAAVDNKPDEKEPAKKKEEPEVQKGSDDLWVSVATSINNIGYLRQQSGHASAEETMQAYQNSLQIKRRVLGKDNLSVGKTLNNLGTVHYLKREYDQALQAYREALQIMMATLGPDHLDVGTVHSNMGDVFWAQSGDASSKAAKQQRRGNDNNNNNSPQDIYQANRDAALNHYRHSLEIRWEELKDHKDPKIIRLLEKIAALEMGESFLALVQNNHRHRMSPKKRDDAIDEEENDTTDSTDPDEAIEAEASERPVQQELQTLHQELQEDVKALDMMERKMAIDMVKDKLRLIREMKKLSLLNKPLDEMSLASGAITPRIKVQPLSPVERNEALCAVKGRLQQLRIARIQEPDIMRRHTLCVPSDLKEADQSPANYVMSQRAQQLLNRTLLQKPALAGIKPSPTVSEFEELQKFSFFNVEHHEIDIGDDDDSVLSDITRSTTLSVSRRGRQNLNEGMDALRSHPVPAAQGNSNHSWMVPTAAPLETSGVSSPPATPLPAASMAAF